MADDLLQIPSLELFKWIASSSVTDSSLWDALARVRNRDQGLVRISSRRVWLLDCLMRASNSCRILRLDTLNAELHARIDCRGLEQGDSPWILLRRVPPFLASSPIIPMITNDHQWSPKILLQVGNLSIWTKFHYEICSSPNFWWFREIGHHTREACSGCCSAYCKRWIKNAVQWIQWINLISHIPSWITLLLWHYHSATMLTMDLTLDDRTIMVPL